MKEAHVRNSTQACEELEMYKTSLQKLDELFRRPIPQEEAKSRLALSIQENLELKDEVRLAKSKLAEFKAGYDDLERNYNTLKNDFGASLNKFKIEKTARLEIELKCKEL